MDASIGQACELQVYHYQNLEIFNLFSYLGKSI
jgi:hypothetical protein